MTKTEIREMVDAIRRVSAEVNKSKESARQFLIDAGIIQPKPQKANKKKK